MNDVEIRGAIAEALMRHVGRGKAIDMAVLHERVFNRRPTVKINGTRRLRKVITQMRRDGVPILSVSTPDGGGYYLAQAGSEFEDYLRRQHGRALRILVMESNLRKISLPELLGQMRLRLVNSEPTGDPDNVRAAQPQEVPDDAA